MIQLTLETTPFTVPNTTCTLEFIRLKSLVGFRKTAPTEHLLAEGIIDTGAYVTVLPNSFAAELELEAVGHYSLSGINRRPECAIPVVVAYGFCILFDEQGHRSPELRVPCYVSQTDEVPVILGIGGLLSEFEFCFDHRKHVAYLK
jgi:hypothetical protein